MQRDSNPWILPVLLAAGVAAAAGYYWTSINQPPANKTAEQDPAQQLVPKPQANSGPVHPLVEIEFPESSDTELRPLPSLDDSDEFFKLELGDLFGEKVGGLLAASQLVERVVATVDNLPRAHVAQRVRPVAGLAEAFVADPEGGELFVIGEEGFRRYNQLASIIEQSDTRELADLYRRYYPLFQSSYEGLGYPNGYFNDRLVEAIDDMLATPDITGDLLLVRPHVLYQFQDPKLESLSSGQKLLLRMGRVNSSIVKIKLQALRDEITRGDTL